MRILFIPRPEIPHTSERTPTLFRMLKERFPVIALHAPWDRLVYNPARSRWPRLLLYAIDKLLLTLRGLFVAYRFRAGLVFCETSHHAVAGLSIARILGIRCAWDSHGNGKLMYESLGKGRWSIRLITLFERFLGKRVDNLITVSETDAAAYRDMGLSPAKIHVLPLCVDLREIDSVVSVSPDERRSRARGVPILLFFGSFGYAPNRDALWFINDRLAPHLERRGIRCEIRIAGRDIPNAPFHPLIRTIGFAPDIHSCIRDADLCIVPVQRGVGMLTKIVDSMAVGTPLVLSEFAARGIPEIRHRIHAYVATTEADFLTCVEEALSSPEDARAMSRRARGVVERSYDWLSCKSRLEPVLLGQLVPPAAGRVP